MHCVLKKFIKNTEKQISFVVILTHLFHAVLSKNIQWYEMIKTYSIDQSSFSSLSLLSKFAILLFQTNMWIRFITFIKNFHMVFLILFQTDLYFFDIFLFLIRYDIYLLSWDLLRNPVICGNSMNNGLTLSVFCYMKYFASIFFFLP